MTEYSADTGPAWGWGSDAPLGCLWGHQGPLLACLGLREAWKSLALQETAGLQERLLPFPPLCFLPEDFLPCLKVAPEWPVGSELGKRLAPSEMQLPFFQTPPSFKVVFLTSLTLGRETVCGNPCPAGLCSAVGSVSTLSSQTAFSPCFSSLAPVCSHRADLSWNSFSAVCGRIAGSRVWRYG